MSLLMLTPSPTAVPIVRELGNEGLMQIYGGAAQRSARSRSRWRGRGTARRLSDEHGTKHRNLAQFTVVGSYLRSKLASNISYR